MIFLSCRVVLLRLVYPPFEIRLSFLINLIHIKSGIQEVSGRKVRSAIVLVFESCRPRRVVIMRYYLLAAFHTISSSLASPKVQISNGTIVGKYLPSFKQDFFLAVPYGDAPIRFEQAIERTTPFNSSFDASNYSSTCYGIDSAPRDLDMSEDCLSINIIRSEGTNNTSFLPVVLWIHGGGFWGNSSADTQLNGSYIGQLLV